ncbi:thiol reductant ABC exporter subunit CydD [Aliiruegeria sabulilitoris]|uniref:thiol reductant ABC exporter subunit CydD n=1 Tax=Aliiruegeria sabulilitoris TaxID=1510458 RepID=UPI0008361C79|nr:thiol reductant ABC exporter subunit CydD [Aliiruegeria sabulilitoris]NDR58246.1 thiol reductant ABC exporter subunit CydD [Pseudoruegeria sp. M32A2M]
MANKQPDAAPDRARERLDAALAPVSGSLRRAGLITAGGSLLWLPQAALVAWLLASLIAGSADRGTALLAAVGFALLGALRAAFQILADRILAKAADRVLARERAVLVAREGRRAPMAAGPRSAELAALASEKLNTLEPYILRYRPAQMRVFTVPLAILLLSFTISWAAGVILLVAGPLIPVFMALVGMAAREASERQMDEIGTLNGMLLERIQALVDIRLLDAGEQVARGFEERAESLRERTMAVLRVAFLSSTVLELFSALGVALVAVYVGFSLLGTIGFGAWGTPLGVGEGVFLLLLAPEFFQPLRDLAAAWHDKASATAVARDLVKAEAVAPVEILGTGAGAVPLPMPDGPALVSVRGLEIGLGGAQRIAFPDFDIACGETCALLGPSGRGKSTLLSALAGLLPVAAGRIEIGGQPLDADRADRWRMSVGWIPQAPHFFSGTLRANLRLGDPEAGDAELLAALRTAHAEEIVERLPRGLLSQLGETGAGVSGGEARRLMIARAALGKLPVILADEPTANLDAQTAEVVTDGLLALAEAGATLIVATHDETLAARLGRRIELGGAA